MKCVDNIVILKMTQASHFVRGAKLLRNSYLNSGKQENIIKKFTMNSFKAMARFL